MQEEKILSELSDNALLKQLEELSRTENQTTIGILLHLAEVERRELYVGLGYSSLFSYCTKKLFYSEPAANRRISCARVASRFPEVLKLLESREVSLSTLSVVAGIITEENKAQVLKAIRGKGRREADVVVSGYRPRETSIAERVRPVCVVKKSKTKQVVDGVCDLFAAGPKNAEKRRAFAGLSFIHKSPFPGIAEKNRCTR